MLQNTFLVSFQKSAVAFSSLTLRLMEKIKHDETIKITNY